MTGIIFRAAPSTHFRSWNPLARCAQVDVRRGCQRAPDEPHLSCLPVISAYVIGFGEVPNLFVLQGGLLKTGFGCLATRTLATNGDVGKWRSLCRVTLGKVPARR
jgi:hypothetical protein